MVGGERVVLCQRRVGGLGGIDGGRHVVVAGGGDGGGRDLHARHLGDGSSVFGTYGHFLFHFRSDLP